MVMRQCGDGAQNIIFSLIQMR